jgi:hypothetical protein
VHVHVAVRVGVGARGGDLKRKRNMFVMIFEELFTNILLHGFYGNILNPKRILTTDLL